MLEEHPMLSEKVVIKGKTHSLCGKLVNVVLTNDSHGYKYEWECGCVEYINHFGGYSRMCTNKVVNNGK